ncbi:unnamed protein product [Arabis nemorensis]|uniref:Uncharacterized protein n=1 Tax=Arabis nemorensis TaxID=586526 RepID=A0A565ASA8_9BRAS|nr:unnamed protein product [Arabis nemorensis]
MENVGSGGCLELIDRSGLIMKRVNEFFFFVAKASSRRISLVDWRAFSVQKPTKEKDSSEIAEFPVVSPLDTPSKTHWLDDDLDGDDDEDFDFAKAIVEAAATVLSI